MALELRMRLASVFRRFPLADTDDPNSLWGETRVLADLLLNLVAESDAKLAGDGGGVGGREQADAAAGAKTGNRKRRKGPKITKEEANTRARDALKAKQKWSVRKLAEAIGCSEGLVAKLPAWRTWLDEHKPKRDRAPKAISATSKVLEAVGEPDSELERLIDEQQSDFEPSPLVSQERKRSRRSKL
jgi:hypothetical protein